MIDCRERWFNRSLDQWVDDTTQEAKRDCVSLQQVYGALADDFNLHGADFEMAVLHVLKQIFESGIAPVVQDVNGGLARDMAFTGSPEKMAIDVIALVKGDPELASFSGIWLGRFV